MRVDRRDDVLDGRLESHRERRLGDQLARLWADDVHADDPLILPRRDDLRQPVHLAQRQRTARRAEVVASDLHVGAVLLFGLGFGQAHLRDLGMCVHDVRRDVVAHHSVLAEDGVNGDLALRRCHVGELRRARITDTVADRPDAGDVRAHPVVDGDSQAVRREAGLLDTRKICDPAGSEENVLAFERLLLPVDLGTHRHARPGALHLGHLRVRAHFHAAQLERAHQGADELRVGVRDRLREHLENSDVASDLREERAELEPDRAPADHDQTFRDLGER